MVYVRRGELRVAYVWKLLRNTDARVCVCVGLPVPCVSAVFSRRLLGDPLGSLLRVSWEPLGRLLGAFWDVLERLGRPLER